MISDISSTCNILLQIFFSSYDFQTCKTVCLKIAFTLAPSISRLKFNQRGKFSPLSSPHADASQPPTQLLQQPILAQELVQPTHPMSLVS